MNPALVLVSGALLFTGMTLAPAPAAAQTDVPADVAALVNTKLDPGQVRLAELGYEAVHSSYAAKTQYWWSEAGAVCISLKISGSDIAAVSRIDSKECEKRVASARAVWGKYSDGPAPARSPKLDAEREKLSGQGYQVAYWVKDISADTPPRSAEFWLNAEAGKCVMIVFEAKSQSYVMTVKEDRKMCTNPAPKKKQ